MCCAVSGDRTLKRWNVDAKALPSHASASSAAKGAKGSKGSGKSKGGKGGKGAAAADEGEEGGGELELAPLRPVAQCSVLAHAQDINTVAISPSDAMVAAGSQVREPAIQAPSLHTAAPLSSVIRSILSQYSLATGAID